MSDFLEIQDEVELREKLIIRSIDAGQYRAAMDIYEQGGINPKILLRFLKFAFYNKDRSSIGSFVDRHSHHLDTFDRIYALSKVITLSEMDGNSATLSKSLYKLGKILNNFDVDDSVTADDVRRISQIALETFYLRQAENLIQKYKNPNELRDLSDSITNFKECFKLAGLDPYDLYNCTIMVAEQAEKKISQPTVVVRITPRIWKSLKKIDNPELLPDGLQFAYFLLHKGYHVEVAPQYALPGPSLFAPYSVNQPGKIVFIDQHKFSSREDCFIHIKSTHNKKVLVDRRGYSGWAEIETMPQEHRFEHIDMLASKEYCDHERQIHFNDVREKTYSISRLKPFGVIPLQMPGDSVQKLSTFSTREMIEAGIEFLKNRGLKAVIRRHPLCKDPEISNYLKDIKRKKIAIISDGNTKELIYHSEVVMLCNSSVGWDAILAHKPLICFGNSEYSRVAYTVKNLADLYESPSFENIVNAQNNDRLYFYYWNQYVANSRKGVLGRVQKLVDYKLV